MDLADRQHLYNGAGNGLARAFELAVTPAVFGFIGHLLDRRLGTSPLFLTTLFLVCVVGMGVRMYYGYREAMAAHDLASPGGRRAAAVPAPSGPEGAPWPEGAG